MTFRILDLFAGAGAVSRGLVEAGFEVVGVDLFPQPRYPYPFVRADALAQERFCRSFDAVWASPPCQAHTALRSAPGAKAHADLIGPTRAMLQRAGVPFVIENVPGAPLRNPVILCGSMFDLGAGGYQLRRHRLFEAGFPLKAPGPCRHTSPVIGVYGGHARCRAAKHGGRGTRDTWPNGHLAAASEAMGLPPDAMTLDEISEAIPPAFAKWIGSQLMAHLVGAREAA